MGTVIIGGVTFPVYGSETGFKNYMLAHVNDAVYDAATNEQRKKSLVSATRWIDRGHWQGEKVDPDQDLAFEYRSGLTDCDGQVVPEDELAPGVEEACYELANYLLSDPTLTQKNDTGNNLRRAKAEGVEVEFFRPTMGSRFAKKYPQEAHELLRCYMAGTGSALGADYGTDVESEFDSEDGYGLIEGFN